jgi:hypothetical protein
MNIAVKPYDKYVNCKSFGASVTKMNFFKNISSHDLEHNLDETFRTFNGHKDPTLFS